MKYFTAILSLVALIALVPALVAADDVEGGNVEGGNGWEPERHRPYPPPPGPPGPPPPTQVLWGQCTFILSLQLLYN